MDTGYHSDWTFSEPFLSSCIESAAEVGELRAIHEAMPSWIARMLENPAMRAVDVCRITSSWHDRMVRRVIRLAELSLRDEGISFIPPYCWMVLGSGGRREQTFWTDQDNALIYEVPHGVEPKDAEGIVSVLSERVVAGLEQAGYPLCRGNVMAVNPRWRGTMEEWRQSLRRWSSHPTPDHHRFFMIAADLRSVTGESALADRLKRLLIEETRAHPAVLIKAAERNARHPIPLVFPGHLIRERYGSHAGKINVKESGYLQLVNALRLWALLCEIEETSTAARLREIAERAGWKRDRKEAVTDALDTFLSIRLHHHIRSDRQNRELDDYVSLESLDREEKIRWKEAMRTAKWMQRETLRRMKSMPSGDGR